MFIEPHLNHIDNLIFEDPEKLCSIFFYFILGEIKYKVKWDGNPSIIYGHHLENGKFFVATKNGFNSKSNPKLIYKPEDIEKHYPKSSPYFRYMIETASNKLRAYGSPGSAMYVHCDLLFGNMEIFRDNDKKYIGFTPNLLTYGINAESIEAIKIIRSDLGMVIHSVYDVFETGETYTLYEMPEYHLKSIQDMFFRCNTSSKIYVVDHSDLQLKWDATKRCEFFKYNNYLNDILNSGHFQKLLTYVSENKLTKHFIKCMNRSDSANYKISGPNFTILLRDHVPKKYHSSLFSGAFSIGFDMMIIIFDYLEKLKVKFLEEIEDPFDVFYNGMRTTHEGLILNDTGIYYKLVSRNNFTKRLMEKYHG